MDIAKPGKLPSGRTEIPFEIPLKAKGNKELYETYHGVFVNIQVKGLHFCTKYHKPNFESKLRKNLSFLCQGHMVLKTISKVRLIDFFHS